MMDEPLNKEENSNEQYAGSPTARFSGTGGLNVAVWKHKSEKGTDYYSVKIDRSHKDKYGNYHSTPYLRDSDLLRACKLLEQVDNWIEQDRGRLRTQLGGYER